MASLINYFLPTSLFLLGCLSIASSKDYIPGEQFEYKSKDLPKGVYQYSVWVPKNYDPKKEYPVVFYLHGGGGRKFPSYGKRNIISNRLVDNQNWTSAGYSGNAHGLHQYIHVAPVKEIYEWEAKKFKALLKHVSSKVNINENRVYVTGFSMGGQGTWIVGCGSKLGYKIAAMMPLGAWGCEWVNHGTTPETCMTTKTPVGVLHCPYDEISIIWNTDELKRTKPTPSEEARWGLAIIEDSLWETIPKVYRRLNDIFLKNMGKGLPKNFNPIEFGSWMGGDRDGNPNVTSKVTKEVLLLSRWEAAKLYEKELTKLIRSYSMKKCSKKIQKLTGKSFEPYRVFLRPLRDKIRFTHRAIEQFIVNKKPLDYNKLLNSKAAPSTIKS